MGHCGEVVLMADHTAEVIAYMGQVTYIAAALVIANVLVWAYGRGERKGG